MNNEYMKTKIKQIYLGVCRGKRQDTYKRCIAISCFELASIIIEKIAPRRANVYSTEAVACNCLVVNIRWLTYSSEGTLRCLHYYNGRDEHDGKRQTSRIVAAIILICAPFSVIVIIFPPPSVQRTQLDVPGCYFLRETADRYILNLTCVTTNTYSYSGSYT